MKMNVETNIQSHGILGLRNNKSSGFGRKHFQFVFLCIPDNALRYTRLNKSILFRSFISWNGKSDKFRLDIHSMGLNVVVWFFGWNKYCRRTMFTIQPDTQNRTIIRLFFFDLIWGTFVWCYPVSDSISRI